MKALLLALLLAAPPAAAHDKAKHPRVDRSLEGWPIEPFGLVDQHGAKFGAERLRGRWTFVLLGDARCEQRCAEGLSALRGLTKRILRSDAVLTTQVLLLVAGAQDAAPAAWKGTLAAYDRTWIGATGPAPVLARLADDLDLAGKGHGALALVGPQGFLHAVYPAPYDVPRLTADFLKARALYR